MKEEGEKVRRNATIAGLGRAGGNKVEWQPRQSAEHRETSAMHACVHAMHRPALRPLRGLGTRVAELRRRMEADDREMDDFVGRSGGDGGGDSGRGTTVVRKRGLRQQ